MPLDTWDPGSVEHREQVDWTGVPWRDILGLCEVDSIDQCLPPQGRFNASTSWGGQLHGHNGPISAVSAAFATRALTCNIKEDMDAELTPASTEGCRFFACVMKEQIKDPTTRGQEYDFFCRSSREECGHPSIEAYSTLTPVRYPIPPPHLTLV